MMTTTTCRECGKEIVRWGGGQAGYVHAGGRLRYDHVALPGPLPDPELEAFLAAENRIDQAIANERWPRPYQWPHNAR